jgi:hypothetical protein
VTREKKATRVNAANKVLQDKLFIQIVLEMETLRMPPDNKFYKVQLDLPVATVLTEKTVQTEKMEHQVKMEKMVHLVHKESQVQLVRQEKMEQMVAMVLMEEMV